MEAYHFENISYAYSGFEENALSDVSFEVRRGEFLVVCGASGSGKSTLLKYLKENNPDFGYVMQNPSAQIVTDKVYHELAFGMENQGVPAEKMRQKIAELTVYFGMDQWMHRDTCHLSGGEKQLVNLASVLATQPDVILLDEPTSQLDPMAATEFLEVVKRINAQLGITVILVEQRLEEVLSVCDRMLVLQAGQIAAFGRVKEVFASICGRGLSREYLHYMPSYIRLYDRYSVKKENCPQSVKEGRAWFLNHDFKLKYREPEKKNENEKVSVDLREVYFRYEKKGRDILKKVSFRAIPGIVYGIVGGNGSGKSTLLKILSGAIHCYHGKTDIRGKVGYLPQEPKYMFIGEKIRDVVKREETVQKFGLEHLLDRHPYDVSGGQMQRLAMAYLYDDEADIYLFDEPTKGVDPQWKKVFGAWLHELAFSGKTVILVSHDVEFAANVCDRMSMCFDADLSLPVRTEEFFRNDHFYTTAIHKIVRDRYPEIVSERYLE